MVVRFAFLVAVTLAAYTVRRISIVKARLSASRVNPSANEETSTESPVEEEEDKSQVGGEDEEEEKEEVKLISGLINPTISSQPHGKDEAMLPEFEEFLSGEIDYPMSNLKCNRGTISDAERDKVHEGGMENNSSEVEELRRLVNELEEREVKLEGELLEYYGLKEQEANIYELQKLLMINTTEIDMLNITINKFQVERKELEERVSQGEAAEKELEVARSEIRQLHRQIQLEANQTKKHLLLLKQQVLGLQAKEEGAMKNDALVEKKLQAVKELEVEVMELKRRNKELQHQKRELAIKLDAADGRIAAISSISESEMVAQARGEISNLRHANEDLLKQVEGLQLSRFSEVEELVYLRWVNACLRYELRNYQSPSGKISARDLNKSLSPRSSEKAKQMMLEYAGSEHGQGETDLESNLSHPSSPGSEDFDNASIESSTSKYSNLNKKQSMVQKLKKWGKSRDDSISPGRTSHLTRGPLAALALRNAGDSVAVTTFGKNEEQGPNEFPENPNLSVSTSFQLMSKSVHGNLDAKYPAFKDRHKLALEREKHIKQRAEQARVSRFGDHDSKTLVESEKSLTLPKAFSKIREKAAISGDGAGQSMDSKTMGSQFVNPLKLADIEKRPPRVPRMPPKPSGGASASANYNSSTGKPLLPPPPPPPPGGPPCPPPPPGSLPKGTETNDKVHRAPELVEFYQTLMKREAKKDTPSSNSISSSSNAVDARSNVIGEIQNRSSFLLAVKADVETQGGFVESLANEVRAASFVNMEDLTAFVNWLDEELSFLVDERAVLKHFDWPEGKVDAFREAAFEYQDLMKLEMQVSSFSDDPKLSCDAALKKMYSMLEKVEQSVYALLRTLDMAMSRYKEFGIPVDWVLDSGVVGKIKLSSVQLARQYMKRVASKLDESDASEEPNREFLVLQGVRFAFRVHQFAGGFDAESMKVFEDLRGRACTQPR